MKICRIAAGFLFLACFGLSACGGGNQASTTGSTGNTVIEDPCSDEVTSGVHFKCDESNRAVANGDSQALQTAEQDWLTYGARFPHVICHVESDKTAHWVDTDRLSQGMVLKLRDPSNYGDGCRSFITVEKPTPLESPIN